MGMAASQARFLGLTARKSNVEYQGQQVNQQRTALANDSANLYNQMMALDVPTPPSANEYYKTYYVLEDSSNGYATTNYKFQNAVKTYDGENRYSITLSTDREYLAAESATYVFSRSSESNGTHSIVIQKRNSNENTKLTYDEKNDSPYKQETNVNGSQAVTKDVFSVTPYQIYVADSTLDDFKIVYGDDAADKDEEGNPKYYFFQDEKGKNNYLTAEQLKAMLKGQDGNYPISSTYTFTKPETTQVKGYLESSGTGRYSSIIVDNNDLYPEGLKGKTFTISTVQEKDELGYNEAYNDYQYQKDVYEHTIDEINAQTEVIQNEDKQLELRLRELETEQNAISTEMDSVKKVIEDNVDKTFNIFG